MFSLIKSNLLNTSKSQSSLHFYCIEPLSYAQMNFLAVPSTGAADTGPGAASFLPFYGYPSAATTAAESGITCNNLLPAIPNSRKRPRNDSGELAPLISSHVQNHMIDVDRLILQHTEKVRMDLMEQQRNFQRKITLTAESAMAKRLKTKDEEIQRLGKLNWSLEQRIKSLYVENQIWRDVAQGNEATANVLRSNLEQVLAAQVKVKKEEDDCAAALAVADDAESCCCGENSEGQGVDVDNKGTAAWRRLCLNCREREPTVLLLPCRHLCLCAACSPAAKACPVCSCSKKGSVRLNMA